MKLTMVKIETQIKDLAKQKAKTLGMTLQGYIKHLIKKDVNEKCN